MNKYLFPVILLVIPSFATIGSVRAQDNEQEIPTAKKLKIADDLASMGSFYNAIEYYKKYLKDEKDDIDAIFKLADAYRNARDYRNAETWYKKAFDSDKKENMNAQYFYALMLKYNGKYDEAKTLFEKIAKTYKGDDQDPKAVVIKMAKEEAKGCELAIKLINDPLKLVVKHLGKNINNPYSDFGPVAATDNRLLYSSIKSDTVVVLGGQERASYVSRIYESRKNTSGSWGKPKEFGDGNINSDQDHTGNGCFSPDGKLFFFSRCREVSPTDLKLMCAIYVSSKNGEGWTRPERLPEQVNKANCFNSQPSCGKGAKAGEVTLYFVSDREEGNAGGQDLYYSIYKKDGSCSAAVNLGKKVNTAGDEVTPFYDNKEQTLYFSSNGRVTMGGFDVYKVKGSQKKFEDPTNVGYPINSSVDDRYFCHTPNHKGGFIVSNRPGGYELKSATCCDDIYQFDYIIIPKFAVKGKIYDSEDKKKKKPLTLALISITPDSADKGGTRYDTTFTKDLKYFFTLQRYQSYKMAVKKDGYYAGSATCSVKGLEDSDTLLVDIFIEKIKPKSVRIEGIFYAYDKKELQLESEPALAKLLGILNENPTIKVEISSHTDNKGDDKYNLKLSQGRAESVVKYLIDKGVDKDRLVAKGYGELLPDTLNSNPDGSDCPLGRAKNRRTEFKIIGQIANTTIIYDQTGPTSVDSAKTSQEVIEREKRGQGKLLINSDGTKAAEDPNKGTTNEADKKDAPSSAAKPAENAVAKPAEKVKSDSSEDEESGDSSTSSDDEEPKAKSETAKKGSSTAKPAANDKTKTTKPASKNKSAIQED